jgi:hypothetical protein
MESIKGKIDKLETRLPRRNFNAEWEVLADEMTNYFGENCYWLFYKKEDWKIRNAFFDIPYTSKLKEPLGSITTLPEGIRESCQQQDLSKLVLPPPVLPITDICR